MLCTPDTSSTCRTVLFSANLNMFVSSQSQADGPLTSRLSLWLSLLKNDGGLRPSALVRTAYRIYAKASARVVRAWASTLPDSQCNNSKGRWVGTPPVEPNLRSYLQSKWQHFGFLLDVSKAFEHVLRNSVAREAKEHDYPMVPLLASLQSPSWPMYIGLNCLVAKPIKATRGIAAGSAFATVELWCFLRWAINSLKLSSLAAPSVFMWMICVSLSRKYYRRGAA
jgi:hypothetical protein